jgi:maltose O-acetyltransferase
MVMSLERHPVVVPQFHDSPFGVLRRQGFGLCKGGWLLLYYAVARHLPDDPMPGAGLANRLRSFLTRRVFRKTGVAVTIHAGVSFGSGAGIVIGDYSSLNRGCWIANDTVMGRDVMMGPEVVILSSGHNSDDTSRPMREQGVSLRRPVVIGDDVWIGTRAVLLPGVEVGSHSIIGAGSVVTAAVAPWSVVAGNPARLLRWRKEPDHAG